MHVLAIYLFILIIGQAVSVGIGLLADRISGTVGVAVFIPVYYAMYWVAWRLTLRIVEGRAGTAPDSTDDKGGSRAAAAIWLLAPATVALEFCD